MTTPSVSSATSSRLGRLLLAGLVAGVAAAVVNAVLYAFGAIDPDVTTPAGQSITLAPVLLFSVVPNVLGGLVLWAILRSGRTVRLFQIIVAVVTVLSLLALPPLGAPTGMLIVLGLMHLVAGAAAALVTPRFAGEA